MTLAPRNECTGCGACSNICPINLIRMIKDKHGFIFPEINKDKCLNCRLCDKVCPIIEGKYHHLFYKNINAYALKHNDQQVLMESTSGGAFTAIIHAFADENTAIFGAVLSNDLTVKHQFFIGPDGIAPLRKSKYVESFIGNSYVEVKQFLNQGRKVIFSGTPCQIAGLRTYLQRSYDNLLTIDIVCHGVPTQLLLEKYLKYREQKSKGKTINIEFRSKVNSDWTNPKIRIEFDNKKVYQQKSYAFDDEYMIGFCKFLSLRKNCSNCYYANRYRVADITIGDFWGIEDSGLRLDFRNGISLLLANTEKGRFIVNYLSKVKVAQLLKVEYDIAIKHNSQLSRPTEADPRREQFLDDLITLPFNELRLKYLKPRSKLKSFLSNYLNRKTKDRIKKLLNMKISKY